MGIFPKAMKGIDKFAKQWERGAEVPGVVEKVDGRNRYGAEAESLTIFWLARV